MSHPLTSLAHPCQLPDDFDWDDPNHLAELAQSRANVRARLQLRLMRQDSPRYRPQVSWVGDLQQGDGGKGAMIDRLAPHYDLVVRTQGGDNSGHTAQFVGADGSTHSLIAHMVPSGLRHPRVVGVIANGVMVNAETLHRELMTLAAIDPTVLGRLVVSERAHLVFPFHIIADGAQEEQKKGSANEIGTTRRGIGPANASKVNRLGIQLKDLRNMDRVRELLTANMRLFGLPAEAVEENLQWISRYRGLLLDLACDTSRLLNTSIDAGASVLLEGSQGPLIDIDHGTYPYVTTCPTLLISIGQGTGLDMGRIQQRLGVLKVYQTMVGQGPFVTELHDDTGEALRSIGREYGATTGRPRRCGWLDLVSARWGAGLNAISELVLTKLDVLDSLETIKLCVAYERHGRMLIDYDPSPEFLADCRPVYKEFQGWMSSTESIERFEDLPANARVFISYITDYLGMALHGVTKGPRDIDLLVAPGGAPGEGTRREVRDDGDLVQWGQK